MRGWNFTLPVAALLSMCVSVQAADKLPAETFSRHVVYDSISISPDGMKLAVTFLREGTTTLAVVDLSANKAVGVAGVKAPDTLTDISWKSNDRIIYRLIGHDPENIHVPVYWAVNRDGGNPVLLNRNPERNGLYITEWLQDLAWEDEQSALIVSQAAKLDYPVVYRVNVMTARGEGKLMSSPKGSDINWPTVRKALFKAPGRQCDYQADNAGIVRTCLTSEPDDTYRLMYRTGDNSEWSQIEHFGVGKDPGLFWPVGFTPDNRQIYVLSTFARNTSALYLYDPEKKALGELLFEAAGVDINDVVRGGDQRTPVAVTYYKQGMGIHYLDAQMADIHQSLNKAFQGQQVRLVSFSRDNGRVVAWVGDSSTPGTYYLVDTKSVKVQKISDLAPWIDRARMATTRAVQFNARDGLQLNGYLTLPRDAAGRKVPLIVQVHGGPHGVRDLGGFDWDSQFFASRGYAVLRINFRGSGGFGREFVEAGHGEWGRKMQSDLEDGVKWLAAAGTIDPDRVGIYGISYGGYAAMMALVTAPDMFKCGISESGVSNLVRMLNARKIAGHSGLHRDVDESEREFWESVVGDRHDEAALREISPVFNVDKIRAPVLIAHGGEDLVVPMLDATDLERALRRAGKDVDLLMIKNEGHGFVQESSRKQFYERMDAFLAKNLPAT